MKAIELLPCRFCGLPGQMKTSQRWSAASCTDVACCGHQIALTHKTENGAAAAWNHRTPTFTELVTSQR
ncbi:Lar family restriction alleviation protein [Cupriavidus pauculus]